MYLRALEAHTTTSMHCGTYKPFFFEVIMGRTDIHRVRQRTNMGQQCE